MRAIFESNVSLVAPNIFSKRFRSVTPFGQFRLPPQRQRSPQKRLAPSAGWHSCRRCRCQRPTFRHRHPRSGPWSTATTTPAAPTSPARAMADLDDFFAKKDRKKSKGTKKFATTEEVAKKLEDGAKRAEKPAKKERPAEGEEGGAQAHVSSGAEAA